MWKLGDRFYKLADQYYGDPTLWWIIAWYNRMPTESHAEGGLRPKHTLTTRRYFKFME